MNESFTCEENLYCNNSTSKQKKCDIKVSNEQGNMEKLCRSPTVLCTVTVGGAPVKNIAILANLHYLMSEL